MTCREGWRTVVLARTPPRYGILSLYLYGRILTTSFLFVNLEPGTGEANNPSPQSDITQSQHILVCALLEMASLLKSLGATALPLVSENQNSKFC